MKPLAFALLLALAGCGCKDGTPIDRTPMLLKDGKGRAYFVEHHMGCTFSVREVPQ